MFGKKLEIYMNCYIIAEIGINHNGDIDIAKSLIKIAKEAGCNAVKFQKRSIEHVYSKLYLQQPRVSPFGDTNSDLKYGLEFNSKQYIEIFELCKNLQIDCFMSVWDEESLEFIKSFNIKYIKIPSARIIDINLLKKCLTVDLPIIISTGMSSIEMIENALKILENKRVILMQCTSAYPCNIKDINLNNILFLKQKFGREVGYSGHEIGYLPTIAAVALGCGFIERHITLDKSMWGSDQYFSLEPNELKLMVKSIKEIEEAMGAFNKTILDVEKPFIEKLR